MITDEKVLETTIWKPSYDCLYKNHCFSCGQSRLKIY